MVAFGLAEQDKIIMGRKEGQIVKSKSTTRQNRIE